MQIAPSYKQSKGISEAQKINFAKHNEALKNLPHAYKKTCISWYVFPGHLVSVGNRGNFETNNFWF